MRSAPLSKPKVTGADWTAANSQDLYDHAPCGLLLLAPDGRILRANFTFAGWVGFSAAELCTLWMRDLITLPGRVVYETNLAPLLQLQGGFEEVALDFTTRSGVKLPTLVNARSSVMSNGEARVIQLAVFRTPERRNYERSLHAQKDAARQSLSNERDIAQLREQFIAVLGHDLRNPLASIVGAAQLLRREGLSAKGLKVVELMEASVDRMTGLIGDVMDFARGRLGSGMGLSKKRLLIEPIVRQVVAELEAGQPNRVIEVEIEAPNPIDFDPGRIGQLVSNLVSNALTHGDDRSAVRVHAEVRDGVLELWVANAGEPISEAALSRLFQPFFRSESRAHKEGLGLGLHIASEIAKAHGGALSVISDAAETRFTLRMPAK